MIIKPDKYDAAFSSRESRKGLSFLEFESSIWIESGSRKMNAKSLLGIMSLSIVTGVTVNLIAAGPDAEAAVNALEALLQRDVY